MRGRGDPKGDAPRTPVHHSTTGMGQFEPHGTAGRPAESIVPQTVADTVPLPAFPGWVARVSVRISRRRTGEQHDGPIVEEPPGEIEEPAVDTFVERRSVDQHQIVARKPE